MQWQRIDILNKQYSCQAQLRADTQRPNTKRNIENFTPDISKQVNHVK